MILKGFKEKSNKNYINSQLKKRSVFNNKAKIKRVGIVFNSEETTNVPCFGDLAKALNISEQAIYITTFKNELKENETIFDSTYTEKHIGWRGLIKNKALKQFLNTQFDVLISYYKEDLMPLKLVTVASKAKFKIGVLEIDERINDLIIKTEIDDFKTFTSELKKYLNILNKI